VSESSDTSPGSLTLEACLVPPAEVAAVWFCMLREYADFPALLIKPAALVRLCLSEACVPACLATTVGATCLPCSLISTLGISWSLDGLSMKPWSSLGTLDTIFPIRDDFGLLGIIFPNRGFASRERTEAGGSFARLSKDDLGVFCGLAVVVPNPVKMSS